MSIFDFRPKKKEENNLKFIPYHHLAIFDRTYKPTKNGEGVICAILCFTVLESFINDLIGVYSFFANTPVKIHADDHPTNNYMNNEERQILESLKSNEREDLLTKLKILGDWDNSGKCFQNLKELKRIRNNLIHLKSEEIIICNESGDLSGYPKFLNNFFQQNIIHKPERAKSWIELLECREFCLWCQETTYQVLTKSIEMLPDSNIKEHFKKESHFFYDSEVMRERYARSDEVT